MNAPPAYSPACCDQKHEVTSEMIYKMLPDILEQYSRLCERHKSMSPKRERIRRLAQPVVTHSKYDYPCPCRDGESGKVRIVRTEQRVRTRTEQLAYPQVSKLLSLKRHQSFPSFEPPRKASVNMLIHKSLHSLYSRLSNTQPPQPPKKPTKWTPQDWTVHKSYMVLLSKAKKWPEPQEPPKTQRAKRLLTNMKRTLRLAKPKTYVSSSQNEWQLTDNMRGYVPTKRIMTLAKHKRHVEDNYDGFQVKPDALHYKASPRIANLASASPRMNKKEDSRQNPFQTSRKALKYKTSARMLELSKPRFFSESNDRSHPYKVSRGALGYKITKRLLELSKPKVFRK